jgi:hypothetical protein
MADQRPSTLRYAAGACGVALYIVLCWILLAVVIVFGALADVVLFDRFYQLALTLTSAEQSRWLWAGGLGFSLVCYACGVYRAAAFFALVPQIREQAEARQRQRTPRPPPPEPHEIPKTRPSAEEIALRGMPRG